MRALIWAAVICFCVTGCGQKGPLRLPSPEEADIEVIEIEQTEEEREKLRHSDRDEN